MKSYDVTIQMKALCLYFHMMLFVCQNFRKWIWKFGRNLPLATFGSERVKNVMLTSFLLNEPGWKVTTGIHKQNRKEKCYRATQFIF